MGIVRLMFMGGSVEVEPDEVRKCPACGLGTPANAQHRFCYKCGYPLMGSCPHCHGPIPKEDFACPFCPFCGERLTAPVRLLL